MENQKTNTVLYAVIAILLFLLVAETGALLFYKMKNGPCPFKSKNKQEQIKTETSTYTPAAAAAQTPATYGRQLQRSPSARNYAPANNNPQGFDQAFDAMQRLQDRMNHLFDTALLYGPPAIDHLMSADQNFGFAPAIDLQETPDSYVVKSDLPGLDKSKINITVEGNLLTIQGQRENVEEKKDDQTGFVTQERSYGSFSRTLNLPGPVDETKIVAGYQNGVLTVQLPKAAGKAAQKVAVQ